MTLPYGYLANLTRNTACIFQRDTHSEEHINVEHIRNKRDVATDSMTQFITNLVKSEVRQSKCGSRGGQGIRTPPGKSQVIRVSIFYRE